MQEKMLRLLEFDKIKEQLAQCAETSLGKEKSLALQPFYQHAQVHAAQEEVDEALAIIRLKGHPPFGGIRDIRPAIQRAQIGSMLNEAELVEVVTTLHGGRRLKRFIKTIEDEETELTTLTNHCERISLCSELEKEIDKCIELDGRVADRASSELSLIRRQLRTFERRIREKLEQIIRSSDNQTKLSDALITIRNERYVIPVKQEYRNAFGGIVHDQSASGQTLFIEPDAVVSMNNQLREAQAKEKHEVERILAKLTEMVATSADELLTNVAELATLDFIFAKAHFAQKLKATKPKLNKELTLRFHEARHPLIPKDQVVPISVELGHNYETLIVTGPNTGGKTVTLKTIGLLTVMVQSGLHIPVREGSEATVFEQIFADIGDEQSIEQNLSTFSSHMTNIVSILQRITTRSLVLFDELGAGTDPEEGAALATAILDHVHHIGARTVATTHYSELKAYAYNRERVMNASVEFNVETLEPTYKLLIGVPGRSNAFEISQRLGLQRELIERAKQQLSSESARVDKMIISLEETKKQVEKELQKAKEQYAEAEAKRQELARKLQAFEQERELRLKEAEEQAKQALEKAKGEAEEVIKELRQYRETSVKEHKLIAARKRLEDAIPTFATEEQPEQSKVEERKDLAIGDEVELIHLSQKGTIVEQVKDGEYLVQVGMLKVNANVNQLKKMKGKSTEPKRSFVAVKGNKEYVKKELDLRGKRLEDARIEVDRYLDDALLAGHTQVSIIHGKGTGALRKGVHELLERHPNMKSFRLGREGEGDLGVTIVELK